MKIKRSVLCLLAFLILGCAKEDIVSNESNEEVTTRALEEGDVYRDENA